MSKARDREIAQAGKIAAANEVGALLARAQAQTALPESAALMKQANDFHNALLSATKDTVALVDAVRDYEGDGTPEGFVTSEEFLALTAYLASLEALTQKAAVVYAKALAFHVSKEPPLSKLSARIDELAKEVDALAKAKNDAPPTSSVIELPK